MEISHETLRPMVIYQVIYNAALNTVKIYGGDDTPVLDKDEIRCTIWLHGSMRGYSVTSDDDLITLSFYDKAGITATQAVILFAVMYGQYQAAKE